MENHDNRTVMLDYNSIASNARFINYCITIFDGQDDLYEIDLKSFGKKIITFGRNTDNDIVLKSSLVSRNHGCFEISNNGIIVKDLNSTNGIRVNGTKQKEIIFGQGDMLRIDSSSHSKPDGVLIIISNADGIDNWCVMPMDETLTIGRDAQNDIVLSHIGVSANHAKIYKSGDTNYIEDLHSTNGVFVNGERITKHELKEKDLITILNTKLIWLSGKLYYFTYQSGYKIDAKNIQRLVKNKGKQICICDNVSLTIEPGSLVAIIGGSGAGKSTFMNAISGYTQPTSGEVFVNGEELYQNYDSLKSIIGYVPQQDIVYDNLTLSEMLNYAAQLKLPDDVKGSERDKRVKEVIEMVELTGKENTLIRSLSGGQKKRASIAVELLPDPSLFFLDEPASGLDPGTERNLMKTLHKMALSGKTVVLVTHSTLNLQECDKIIFMGAGGRLCYYGSAVSALDFFEVSDLVDVYNLMTEKPEFWQNKYISRKTDETEDVSRSGKVVDKSKHNRLKQVGVLSKRYLKLVWNDKQRLLLLLLQAPLLGFLISLVKDGHEYVRVESTKSLLFSLACCAFWLGTLNAIQEICKERTILRREYMTGVRFGTYIFSKFIVLGLLSLIQSVLLVGTFVLTVGASDEALLFGAVLEMLITCFMTILAAVASGLFVSSLFTNTDRAMTVAPLLLMPQLLFSGILFKLEGITDYISYIAVSRWAMEGLGTSVNLNNMYTCVNLGGLQQEYPVKADEFFTFEVPHLLAVWLILLVYIIIFGVLSVINLKRTKDKI